MSYLIMQMLFCLLVAFLLGLFLGYLLCCMLKCKTKTSCGHTVRDHNLDTGYDDDYNDLPDMPVGLSAAAPVIATGGANAMTPIDTLDTDIDLDGEGYGVQTLEGIGPKTGDLFRSIGVATVGDYLRRLHSPALRAKAAQDLSIKIEPLHEWASMSDLLRIGGVDHQSSELMHASGIQTVADLAANNADVLVSKMDAVNNAGPQLISPSVPEAHQVRAWIARAKNMAAAVSV